MKVQWLQKIEATWSKPKEWKKFTSLSRLQAASILDTAGLRPEPFGENTDVQGFRKGCTKKNTGNVIILEYFILWGPLNKVIIRLISYKYGFK